MKSSSLRGTKQSAARKEAASIIKADCFVVPPRNDEAITTVQVSDTTGVE